MSLIKKGDKVWVISGTSPDQRPTHPVEVLEVYRQSEQVVLDGFPLRKRAERMRQTQEGGREGGIITESRPIHISNVMISDPETNKPVRMGIKVKDDGTKVRVTRGRNASGSEVE